MDFRRNEIVLFGVIKKAAAQGNLIDFSGDEGVRPHHSAAHFGAVDAGFYQHPVIVPKGGGNGREQMLLLVHLGDSIGRAARTGFTKRG